MLSTISIRIKANDISSVIIIWSQYRSGKHMVKRSVTITLDEKNLAKLEADRGLAPLSALINRFIEVIYSENTQISEDLHTCRALMGFRNTPETVEYLLKEALTAKREDLEFLRENHPLNGSRTSTSRDTSTSNSSRKVHPSGP